MSKTAAASTGIVEQADRYRGSLIGLAVGDALGTTLEFTSLGGFEPISDLVGGGPYGLRPGQWTDDTAMALCLAESLIECRGFDPADQMRRYLRWYREGYLSCTGYCFGMGSTVRAALERFECTGRPYSGCADPDTAGNGSIMRLAPVALLYARDPEQAVERAADSSRTTHAAPTAVDACRYLAALIAGALLGVDKVRLLGPRYAPVPGCWERRPLDPLIDEIAAGSFRRKEPAEIRGTGYVVRSLEAALWAFARSESFEEGALSAVNLGEDADSTGAVYGQLAGAFYGLPGIPARWVTRVALRDKLESYAERLCALSGEAVGGCAG